MKRSVINLKDLASILNKDNKNIIISAISTLRNESHFEGAIELLTSYYDSSVDSEIRKCIESFMNDLKDQSVTEEVINEIRKNWKPETISMLIASCWQSGLNYSDYSSDLAEVFLKSDYVTAIECLTVIEESVPELSTEKKVEIIDLIKNSPVSTLNEKRSLAIELIAVLEK